VLSKNGRKKFYFVPILGGQKILSLTVYHFVVTIYDMSQNKLYEEEDVQNNLHSIE
jgi:hypothetical protein